MARRERTREITWVGSAGAERRRLEEDAARERHWKRWGPYLAERQWATVREDYSEHGNCWEYFPHDHARSRAYRWGEDGLLGICDQQCRLAFALALWNERDPILKERLFGLTGPEGNHGEDVKEVYHYLDSTPTHSYTRALYKYPQAEFPYARLVEENRRRERHEPEFELLDTGVFEGGRYFDVVAEYAKAAPNDIAIRITAHNRGPEPATLHLLPTLWFRNVWAWGRAGEEPRAKPSLHADASGDVVAEHPGLGRFFLAFEPPPDGAPRELLFTENDTNLERLYRVPNPRPFVKDAFHACVVDGRREAANFELRGTKAAAHYRLEIPPGGCVTLRLRLFSEAEAPCERFGPGFERVFGERIAEADAFYREVLPAALSAEERAVARQACAGLLFSKQFYHYVVEQWLEGDPAQPPPPTGRGGPRNRDWSHLYGRDVVSMPDKWEYPWFAAWDLAFHVVPLARLDPHFAKQQLLLFLREWYMHPNGQIPAYEFAFGDVNPPVHAWAAWRVYKISGEPGKRDRAFLRRVFDKLLMNFTWWVNRKDAEGNHVFGGGFLGLDNIGVFDRSQPLPTGGHLEQADGTAWMAFYCSTMLAMALELAAGDPVYEDVASKFFEHFVHITAAMNELGGSGLWDEADGFYYDQLHHAGRYQPLKVRSLVGLLPLCAVEPLEVSALERLPGFAKRLRWFLAHRPHVARHVTREENGHHGHLLLSVVPRDRLERLLRYLLDEREFLSPHGIRSVSRVHVEHPYRFFVGEQEHRVEYVPGESTSGLFGGNSNWRGPIWFPVNYLLLEALERHHHFYGDTLRVELPTGSGRHVTLQEAAGELAQRLARLFLPDERGVRPCFGPESPYSNDRHFRELLVFNEYFHGDSGRGLGARYQGWTYLVTRCLEDLARRRVESA
jgi:hypothetical protein